ncbi:hypothetical protein B5F53_08620 [Blautia sp. An249]|uniref:beta-L-arabinofuranosidase domain-containing protein n=1 Tax=Blautia sp. An249 TaxID=1965603 RepID=UPI000B3AC53F|nr:beta-L-arabinofuranosidase domain-containing protein [Blautia sp. An249]OUO79128.1 hypothetical protein B5F53_08620 [Blautia sp. An249]
MRRKKLISSTLAWLLTVTMIGTVPAGSVSAAPVDDVLQEETGGEVQENILEEEQGDESDLEDLLEEDLDDFSNVYDFSEEELQEMERMEEEAGPAAQAEEADASEPDAQAEEGLVLYYDFESLKNGTIINDQSGTGKAGVVRPTGSQAQIEEVEIFGETYTAFVMNGGQPDETHTYAELPSGALNDLDSMTVSCWVYVKENQGYQRIWDFGHNSTSYMYLLTDGYNAGHTGYTVGLTDSGWSNEEGPESATLEAGKWIYSTVTFDGESNTIALYKDGALMGETVSSVDLSVLQNSTQNWIGYGQFGNDIFNGMVADFKIYNYAMTADEVADSFAIPDEDKVARDKESLSLGDTSAVTENLTLPLKGSAGSDISWESSNPDVVATDGTVTRPGADQEDVVVTLTATITAGEVTDSKTFEVTVKRELSDEEKVAADLAAIDLGELDAVMDNLTLPQAGDLGSTFSWATSDASVVAADGTITRPAGKDKTATLTVTATSGEASATREFEVTVSAVYTKTQIKEVESVEVETQVNHLPTLPNEVTATYEDDSTAEVKVVWPTNLKATDFGEKGAVVELTGTVVGYDDVKVSAKVTVVGEVAVPAEASAEEFDLSDINLDGTDTIYGQNMERALTYLKIMDADRMLYNFRMTFGASTEGAQPLTGWEEPSGLLRGHSTGHFLSALALAYASSGDEEYKEKMDYMVSELHKLQQMSKGKASDFVTKCTPTSAAQGNWSKDPNEWGEGFLSAYSPDQFALLEQYTPYATIWAPYYTLHKLIAGFIDCYEYGGNEEALEVAEGIASWCYDRLANCTTEEQRKKMWDMYIAGEQGGITESMARLYEITKEDKYIETAKMFNNAIFFDNLAVNIDDIQTRHANQHIPQIVGAIHEYAATGDSYYYNVAKNFWDMVISRYAYSIGGVGTGETFKYPYQQGAYILGNTGRGENCETCAAYNLLKLTKDLYLYDPDNAAYMDYYERTVMNQIAASQSHDTTEWMHNGCTYMLPIDPGQRRDYDYDYGGFTCCNGTGMENHVKYQQAAYAKSGDTLYVNLYMPTTVDWAEKGISVTQDTTFPSENSKLTVNGSGDFTMKLRVPYWATEGFTVKVNGDTICTNPKVSSYVEINRTWADGDVVEIDMPYTLHLDETPDKVDGDTVASLMYGPIVMVAKDTRSSYTPMNWYKISLSEELEESVQIVQAADGSGKVPHLVTNNLDFYPMYDAYNYRYHAYVKVEEKAYAEPGMDEETFGQVMPQVTAALGEEGVTVDWDAIEGAASYRIYRKEAGGSFAGLATVGADVTSYVDKTAEAGKTYYYTVKGFWGENATGTATKYPTNVVVSTHTEDTFADVMMKVTAKAAEDNSVIVNWTSVGAASYRIYRKEAKPGAAFAGIANVTGDVTSYTDETAEAGKTYYYTVRGFWGENATGTATKYPSDVMVSVNVTALDMPVVATKSVNYSNVDVSWDAVEGAQKYVIYRKEAKAGTAFKSIGTVSAATLKFRDSKASLGVNYYYTVKAYAGSVASDYQRSVTGMAVMSSPALKGAQASSKGITVTWSGSLVSANQFADGYRVFRKTAGSSWKTVGTVGKNVRSFTDTTAKAGTTYTYTVRAYYKMNGANLWGTYDAKGVSAAK